MIERGAQRIIEQQRFNIAYESIFNTAISILKEHGKPKKIGLFSTGLTVNHILYSTGVPVEICVIASKKNLDRANKVEVTVSGLRKRLVVKKLRRDNIVFYEGGEVEYVFDMSRLWYPSIAEDYLTSLAKLELTLRDRLVRGPQGLEAKP